MVSGAGLGLLRAWGECRLPSGMHEWVAVSSAEVAAGFGCVGVAASCGGWRLVLIVGVHCMWWVPAAKGGPS